MKLATVALVGGVGIAALGLGLAADGPRARPTPLPSVARATSLDTPPAATRQRQPEPSPSHAQLLSVEQQRALVGEFCLACHDQWEMKAELNLEAFDFSKPDGQPQLAEKLIKKLRAGMMPPSGSPRPEAVRLAAFAASLEARMDAVASVRPNPGRRAFQRLNRAEYARSVKALLDLDVDVTAYLPADTISDGFDNIADAQGFSPVLMEGYLRAANAIARQAMGDPGATASEATYKVPRTMSQLAHVDGAPMGTRGGLAVEHTFPADGDYVFRLMLHGTPTGQLFGGTAKGEQIEISINGERAALLDINPKMQESDPAGLTMQTPPIAVRAGPQVVAAAFIQRLSGPVDDLIAPIEHTLADTQIGSAQGITTFPHLRDLSINGPHRVTGISDTPSRRRIFICRPTTAADELPCATSIVRHLAGEAYRRPVTDEDMRALLKFYDMGRGPGTASGVAGATSFEDGIRTVVQAVLASPHFVLRLERTPVTARPGQPYRVTDLELASRLSYFLWAQGPDAELLRVAASGTLSSPAALRAQVARMLADPRAEALSTRFASQWLRLQDLHQVHPDALQFPMYDRSLALAMQRETELFFDSIVREDRSVFDLITANYTFANERLARHYRVPNVTGSHYRKVTMTDDYRQGLLGHGSILTLTSIADRTSPVLRGKWVLEVLFGIPPPPPPPNVPDLATTRATAGGRTLSVRERMEEHRANPACTSCHKVIDPLGLALDGFDVTGAWRIKDNGVAVDATGTLYDGTPLDGPVALRRALVRHQDVILRNFTDNLLAYALGRRVEYFDQPAVRAIARDAARQGNRFSAFVFGIVNSPAFQMSVAEAAATEM